MTDLCNEVNKFGKGIGNAARYRIVQALLKGRKTVNELTKIVKLSQSAVSQHLKTLKECNLVVDERSGKEVFYAFNTEHTVDLLKNLTSNMNHPNPKRSKPKKSKR